jgi:hypothetical protein
MVKYIFSKGVGNINTIKASKYAIEIAAHDDRYVVIDPDLLDETIEALQEAKAAIEAKQTEENGDGL